MLYYKRCSSDNQNFQELVKLLDADLALRDGDDNAFYAQFNGIVELKNCVVFYSDETPVACGAFKRFNEDSVEIKRMIGTRKMGKRIELHLLCLRNRITPA